MGSADGVSEKSGSPPQSDVKQYGITNPLSFAGPTNADRQRTSELEKVYNLVAPIFFLTSSFWFVISKS